MPVEINKCFEFGVEPLSILKLASSTDYPQRRYF